MFKTNYKLDVIDHRRIDAVSKALDLIHSLLKDYKGPAALCSRGNRLKYDTIVLGGLIRGLHACGLLVPPPHPHHRLSFTDLSRDFRNTVLPNYYSKQISNGWDLNNYGSTRNCSVKTKINASLNNLETELTGLRLKQFGRG